MTRRSIAVLAAAVLAAAALTGCGNAASKGKTGTKFEVIHVDVDGTKVPCVVTGSRGGITCAWQDR